MQKRINNTIYRILRSCIVFGLLSFCLYQVIFSRYCLTTMRHITTFLVNRQILQGNDEVLHTYYRMSKQYHHNIWRDGFFKEITTNNIISSSYLRNSCFKQFGSECDIVKYINFFHHLHELIVIKTIEHLLTDNKINPNGDRFVVYQVSFSNRPATLLSTDYDLDPYHLENKALYYFMQKIKFRIMQSNHTAGNWQRYTFGANFYVNDKLEDRLKPINIDIYQANCTKLGILCTQNDHKMNRMHLVLLYDKLKQKYYIWHENREPTNDANKILYTYQKFYITDSIFILPPELSKLPSFLKEIDLFYESNNLKESGIISFLK